MKVNCPSCGAKYTIADDRVRGRKVKVRCKSCSTPIVVDGTSISSDAPAEAPAAQPAAAGAVGAGNDEQWSVNLSETEQRDMTRAELVAGWNSGQIPEDAYVWKDGMSDWLPILEAPELRGELSPERAAQAAAPATGTPLPGAGGGAALRGDTRAQDTADLFGNIASAGSEEDQLSNQDAIMPTPYIEQKPTGARNENSVLFSLDSLKAGFPAPAARSQPAQREVSSSDPFGMSSNDSLAGFGGGALFGASANQALLTAPVPPEPEPPKASVPGSPGAGRSKFLLGVGAGAALLLAVVLVLAMTGGSKDEQTVVQANAEVVKQGKRDQGERERDDKGDDEPDRAAKEPGEEEKGGEEAKQDDEKTAAPGESDRSSKSTPSQGDTAARADSTRTPDKDPGTTTPQPAKAVQPGPKVEVKNNPSSGVADFNKMAARTALANAAAAAPSCKRTGGPTGAGKAIVTFAPSGRVTTANVTGAFAGTSVGGCIASLFRKARVPAFNGAAVTVAKSFSIQ